MRHKDRFISVLILSVCAFFYYMSFDIPVRDTEGLGPAFFPRLILGFIAGLAVLMFIRSFLPGQKKKAEGEDEPDEEGKRRGKKVWLIFLIFAVYVFVLDTVGFILSSFLFMVGVYLLVSPHRTTQKKLITIGVLLVVTVILGFSFETILGVPLPGVF